MREALTVELPLRRIFEEPRLAGFAAAVERARRQGDGPIAPTSPPLRPVALPSRSGQDLPLSFAQERLWFLDQLTPGSPAYNIPLALRLSGRLDRAVLTASLQEIVRRHESLRTTFVAEAGQPVQRIAPWPIFPFPLIDLRGLPVAAGVREGELLRRVEAEAGRAFDLAQGPLLRGTLVRLADEEHAALLTLHHIVADGWSTGVLLRELQALYASGVAGCPSPLPDLPLQYADFALWQRGPRVEEVLAEQLAYWRQALAGLATLELPVDRPRPPLRRGRGASRRIDLPPELSRDLEALQRSAHATLFMALLAGFAALLSRYTGQDDVAVGSPIANRNYREIEGLIGFFVNTLVFRLDDSGDPSFLALVAQARRAALAAYEHQDVPFERVVGALSPERDPSRTPLFQVLFQLQSGGGQALSLPGLTLAAIPATGETAKFDLTLALAEGPAGLSGVWEYDRDLFEETTIARLSDHFATLLAGAVAAPGARLSELPLLSAAERGQLQNWSTGLRTVLPGLCAHHLFLNQARRTPAALALLCGADRLTYRELAERVLRLAGVLRAQGVGPEILVGVCLERTVALPVALLAVLAAGGAYVPIDPTYPPERQRLMLEDSGARLLLTAPALLPALPDTACERLLLDGSGLPPADLPRAPERAGPGPGPENLAYVLYTSGSTGRPKGVEIRHAGLVNFLASMMREPGFSATDTLLAVTTVSFDIAGLELYLPLAVGGRIVLASRETATDGTLLARALVESGATVLQATPATWRLLLAAGWPVTPGLTALCGGEALPRDLAAALLGRVDSLWNLYGPTETTIWSTLERVLLDEPAGGTMPIGHPIANTRSWVLDRHLDPVPVGSVGSLYLGGAGLARGYRGRPDLTAERFVPDPWSDVPGARLYRTGDLARYLPSGRLVFLGRADHQVKVRGYRIELGEIEAVLCDHPGVRQVVVLAREDVPGDRRLVAYVVGESGTGEASPDLAAELRAHTVERLPAYLVPAVFVTLPALLLSPAGKVDRGALPVPEWREASSHLAPRGPVEEVLVRLWQQILGGGPLGVRDDFFRLGGHSLLATQLIARIRATFQVELPLRRLFDAPTVETLAATVLEAEATPGKSEKIARALLRLERAKAAEAREEIPATTSIAHASPAVRSPVPDPADR